jgi:hypothetical protein
LAREAGKKWVQTTAWRPDFAIRTVFARTMANVDAVACADRRGPVWNRARFAAPGRRFAVRSR